MEKLSIIVPNSFPKKVKYFSHFLSAFAEGHDFAPLLNSKGGLT